MAIYEKLFIINFFLQKKQDVAPISEKSVNTTSTNGDFERRLGALEGSLETFKKEASALATDVTKFKTGVKIFKWLIPILATILVFFAGAFLWQIQEISRIGGLIEGINMLLAATTSEIDDIEGSTYLATNGYHENEEHQIILFEVVPDYEPNTPSEYRIPRIVPMAVHLTSAILIFDLYDISESLHDMRNFCSETVIGKSTDNEEIYIHDLINTPFLMNFTTETGEGVRLLGQLNEYREWDGLIIHNRYEDDELISLFETRYESGTRDESYIFISRGTTDESGQSRIHFLIQNRRIDYVEIFVYSEIVVPMDKLESDGSIRYRDVRMYGLISYFRGNTSDGFFNDMTGNAISISFDEDGYIRHLYNGHFVNGHFEDSRLRDNTNITSSAFRIAWRHDESGYTFYEGPFVDGSPYFSYQVTDGFAGEGHIRRIDVNDPRFSNLLDSLDLRPNLLRWRTI